MPTDIVAGRAPTGRVILEWTDDGDVAMDESEEHAVLTQLVERRGEWLADTAGTHGSDLRKMEMLGATSPSQARAAAQQALQVLVDARRISGVTIDARRGDGPGQIAVGYAYTTPDGQRHEGKV